MKDFWEKFDNYQKNLWSLQDVTDKLISHMRGHYYSFLPEITDKKGNFKQEKLRNLVEKLLSGWAEKVRGGTDNDPVTGESMAEPYLKSRLELYGLYLYLTMRCSICQGAFQTLGGTEKERTDFAFLLEQARLLSRSWCVMEEPGKEKTNELYLGYDKYFGLHLYHPLTDPEGNSMDSALTPYWKAPVEHHELLTNEGNMKRIFLRHLSSAKPVGKTEDDEMNAAMQSEDDSEEDFGITDSEEDFGILDTEEYYDELDLAGTDYDWKADQKRSSVEYYRSILQENFDGKEEYLSACKRFVMLFGHAEAELLRDFYDDLVEIVDLYLMRMEIAPLTDTDKTLDVYSRIYDGPYRRAKRYARGSQWRKM